MPGSGSGAGDGGGGSSGVSKLIALLFGGGLVAILSIFGPRFVRDDDSPNPAPATPSPQSPVGNGAAVTTAPTIQPAVRTPNPTSAPGGEDDLRGDPDNVIITVTVYGMPGRVSVEAADPSVAVRQRVKEVCSPDQIFPGPCVTSFVAKRGSPLLLIGGNALAGYWPTLAYARGAGCTIGEVSKDFRCPFTAMSDMSVEARYYGNTTPDDRYEYPKCPKNFGNVVPAWTSRCR